MPIPYRHRVLVLLFFLAVITYLDRICIAVAGPRMQAELGLSPSGRGLPTRLAGPENLPRVRNTYGISSA